MREGRTVSCVAGHPANQIKQITYHTNHLSHQKEDNQNGRRPTLKTTKIRVGPTYFVMGGDLYPPIGGVHMGGTRVRWGGFTRESRQNWKSPKIGLKTSNKSFHRAKIAIAMTKLLLKLSICQEYGH